MSLSVNLLQYKGPTVEHLHEFVVAIQGLPHEADHRVQITAFGPCSDFRKETLEDVSSTGELSPLYHDGGNIPTFGIRRFRGLIGICTSKTFAGSAQTVGSLVFNGAQIHSRYQDLPQDLRGMVFLTGNHGELTHRRYEQSQPIYHNGLILGLDSMQSIKDAILLALPRNVPNVIGDLVVAYHDGDLAFPSERLEVQAEDVIPVVPRSGRFPCLESLAACVKSAAKTVCCCCCNAGGA